jgi:hypothetical protein
VDFEYLALQPKRRSYLLFTEADYRGCDKGSVTICAATTAAYNTQTLKCEASLFFRSEEANQLCRRKLIFHHPTPILRHGELWVYHLPREQQVALRCIENHYQVIRTMSLTGAGLIHNATRCSISSDEFQTFPELRGATREELRAPTLHLPDNITVVTDFELQQLREIPPLATRQLDDIHDQVTASMQTYDVESLLHPQQTSQLQEKRTNHLIIISTSLCALPIFSILCFLLYTHTLRYILRMQNRRNYIPREE